MDIEFIPHGSESNGSELYFPAKLSLNDFRESIPFCNTLFVTDLPPHMGYAFIQKTLSPLADTPMEEDMNRAIIDVIKTQALRRLFNS